MSTVETLPYEITREPSTLTVRYAKLRGSNVASRFAIILAIAGGIGLALALVSISMSDWVAGGDFRISRTMGMLLAALAGPAMVGIVGGVLLEQERRRRIPHVFDLRSGQLLYNNEPLAPISRITHIRLRAGDPTSKDKIKERPRVEVAWLEEHVRPLSFRGFETYEGAETFARMIAGFLDINLASDAAMFGPAGDSVGADPAVR